MSTATEEAFQMKGCPTMKIQMTWINAPSYYKLDDCEVHHQNKKKEDIWTSSWRSDPPSTVTIRLNISWIDASGWIQAEDEGSYWKNFAAT